MAQQTGFAGRHLYPVNCQLSQFRIIKMAGTDLTHLTSSIPAGAKTPQKTFPVLPLPKSTWNILQKNPHQNPLPYPKGISILQVILYYFNHFFNLMISHIFKTVYLISVMSDLHLHHASWTSPSANHTISISHWSPNILPQSVLNAWIVFYKTEEIKTHIDYSKTEMENEKDESGGRRWVEGSGWGERCRNHLIMSLLW